MTRCTGAAESGAQYQAAAPYDNSWEGGAAQLASWGADGAQGHFNVAQYHMQPGLAPNASGNAQYALQPCPYSYTAAGWQLDSAQPGVISHDPPSEAAEGDEPPAPGVDKPDVDRPEATELEQREYGASLAGEADGLGLLAGYASGSDSGVG